MRSAGTVELALGHAQPGISAVATLMLGTGAALTRFLASTSADLPQVGGKPPDSWSWVPGFVLFGVRRRPPGVSVGRAPFPPTITAWCDPADERFEAAGSLPGPAW